MPDAQRRPRRSTTQPHPAGRGRRCPASRPAGRFRCAGAVREIRFFETGSRVLKQSGFALRPRGANGSDRGDAEAPAAGPLRRGRDGAAAAAGQAARSTPSSRRTSRRSRRGATAGLTVANPPSIRSRFARSTSQGCDGGLATPRRRLRPLPDAGRRACRRRARRSRETDPARRPGRASAKRCSRGRRPTSARTPTPSFALTWWDFLDAAEVRHVAEISYKVKTPDGEMGETSGAARAAALRRSAAWPRRLARPRPSEQDRAGAAAVRMTAGRAEAVAPGDPSPGGARERAPARLDSFSQLRHELPEVELSEDPAAMADTASRHVLTEAVWPAEGAGLWVEAGGARRARHRRADDRRPRSTCRSGRRRWRSASAPSRC